MNIHWDVIQKQIFTVILIDKTNNELVIRKFDDESEASNWAMHYYPDDIACEYAIFCGVCIGTGERE